MPKVNFDNSNIIFLAKLFTLYLFDLKNTKIAIAYNKVKIEKLSYNDISIFPSWVDKQKVKIAHNIGLTHPDIYIILFLYFDISKLNKK